MTDHDVHDVVTSDSDAQRETLLRKAYEGELIGEAMYARLSEIATTEYQRTAAHLASEVERATAETLLPLMTRHGVSFDRERARQIGLDFTNDSIDAGWHAYFAKVMPLAAGALEGMKRLHKLSDDADRWATAALVEHEEALLEFLRRELDGAPDSIAPLQEYLDGLARSGTASPAPSDGP